MIKDKNVLSLFSSAGIGELGIKASGFSILLSNELLSSRCALYSENYRKQNAYAEISGSYKMILQKLGKGSM